jgi:hypothetical protein
VVAAKSLVLLGVLFVVALVTAVLGYLGGNWFLGRRESGSPSATRACSGRCSAAVCTPRCSACSAPL